MNVRAELARREFLYFVQYVRPFYDANWHHELLCEYLQKFINGEIKRLMVFMPPQHGKSELVSRCLPAYLLGKNPKAKVVLASYSSDLSSSFNMDCQRIIDSDLYKDVFPETELAGNGTGNWKRNSEIFEVVDEGGFLKTTGVGGSLTGTAADFGIIDDPVKDSVEAASPTYQLRNWDWFNDVFYTRIHNETGILITQTRWNPNDLSGKLLQKMMEESGEKWVVLCLPAIKIDNSEPRDPREIGDALWPKMHNLKKLMQVRSQSIRTFQSLYQQNPQPVMAGGEFYKCFDAAKHVKTLTYDKTLPLHLSFDFNVNPYITCTVWQIKNEVIIAGEVITKLKHAMQVKEICTTSPHNTTKGICNEVKRIYPGHDAGMFIYGDPTGVQQDTRSEKGYNDYTIIMQELAIYKPANRVQRSAPPVVMRGNFINTVLEDTFDGLDISVDSKCTNTVADYLYLKEDADGTKKKDRVKDPATSITFERYGHCSDANDYFLCAAFGEEFVKYQRGGATSKIALGKNKTRHAY